jgi:hypothetical protein
VSEADPPVTIKLHIGVKMVIKLALVRKVVYTAK